MKNKIIKNNDDFLNKKIMRKILKKFYQIQLLRKLILKNN